MLHFLHNFHASDFNPLLRRASKTKFVDQADVMTCVASLSDGAILRLQSLHHRSQTRYFVVLFHRIIRSILITIFTRARTIFHIILDFVYQ
jgi:hypothetical protein